MHKYFSFRKGRFFGANLGAMTLSLLLLSPSSLAFAQNQKPQAYDQNQEEQEEAEYEDEDNAATSGYLEEREGAAQYKADASKLWRMRYPQALYLSFGTPAPAFWGLSASSQLSSELQLLLSYGRFWSKDLTIHSAAASLRVQMFQTDFTPILGGGVNALFFRGDGSIQTLEESSLLISLLAGLDWSLSSRLRVSAGFTFHIPLRLNFPFVDIGWSF